MVSDAFSWLPHNLKTVWNIIMILHSYVVQGMTICRILEQQLSLSYFLSHFPLMVSDAILCPVHNLKIVWNISMILYSYKEQVMTMCPIQEWQLLQLYFLSYFPLIISNEISCPLYNMNTLLNKFMKFYSYLEQVMMICHVQE